MQPPQESKPSRSFPNPDRLSFLTAIIFLAYLLTRFVSLPVRVFAVQLPGFYLSIRLDFQTVVIGLVAILTAAGTDWLLHDHPARKGRRTLPFILLPALTSIVIGLPLNQLSYGIYWWLALVVGGTLLVLVWIGEYISIDAEDIRQPLAAAGLIAVSFGLYLVLVASLRTAGWRLFLFLPAVTLGAVLVSLRTLHLRMHGEWLIYESLLIAFIVGQISTPLYYWPLSPLSLGLLVLGPTYALISLMIGLIEERPARQLVVEPLLAILVVIGAAYWVR